MCFVRIRIFYFDGKSIEIINFITLVQTYCIENREKETKYAIVTTFLSYFQVFTELVFDMIGFTISIKMNHHFKRLS